jgi:hypothetical protein
MKKNTIVLFSLFTAVNVTAQEVVSTQGDSYVTSIGSIDFTLGEVIINTETDGSHDLTQGFHQTNWNFLGVEDFAPDYEASIFPNPTSDILNIKSSSFENVTYTIYDAQGKLVLQSTLAAEVTPVQVSHIAPGSYSLQLTFEEGKEIASKSKIFKLIKSY